MTERARYWADVVSAWERSGLSQAEFCRRRGVKVASLAWWKRQLRKPSSELPKRRGRPAKASKQFVEVRLTGTSSVPTYEVVLARGRSIRVLSQFDPQILSQLITAVESC
jgi:transposase